MKAYWPCKLRSKFESPLWWISVTNVPTKSRLCMQKYHDQPIILHNDSELVLRPLCCGNYSQRSNRSLYCISATVDSERPRFCMFVLRDQQIMSHNQLMKSHLGYANEGQSSNVLSTISATGVLESRQSQIVYAYAVCWGDHNSYHIINLRQFEVILGVSYWQIKVELKYPLV